MLGVRLTPAELAEQWRCSTEHVLDLIRAGRLRGFSISPPGSKRPRWRISPDAVAEYEARQQGRTPIKPARRKKGRAEAAYEYYP